MSRSKKHVSITGKCVYRAGAARAFRKISIKRMRAATKRATMAMTADPVSDATAPRTHREVIDRWNAPDDGRFYFGDRQDAERFLRK